MRALLALVECGECISDNQAVRYQDQVVRMTQAACRSLFQTAHAVPGEKLEWKPSGTGRSVLSQLQECALVPLSFTAMLNARSERYSAHHCPPEFEEAQALFSKLTTVSACEQACKVNTQVFLDAIRAFPSEELESPISFSYPGISIGTLADLMMFHYWNCVYHTGQINYIQTLYGDLEIH